MSFTCSCGLSLRVFATMRDQTPITRCSHCDSPCMWQSSGGCIRCLAYDQSPIRHPKGAK